MPARNAIATSSVRVYVSASDSTTPIAPAVPLTSARAAGSGPE